MLLLITQSYAGVLSSACSMRGTCLFNCLQELALCRVTFAHGLIQRLLHSTHAVRRRLENRVLSANLSLSCLALTILCKQ